MEKEWAVMRLLGRLGWGHSSLLIPPRSPRDSLCFTVEGGRDGREHF